MYEAIIRQVNLILTAIIFTLLGGILLYTHDYQELEKKNPFFLGFGIAFVSSGSMIIISMFQNLLFPKHLLIDLDNAKRKLH